MRQPQALKALTSCRPACTTADVARRRDLREQDDDQRQEQAQRRRGLDPAGEEAALVLRRVLGDIDRRAAVFAAERQALQHAQRDQRDGRQQRRWRRRSAAGRRGRSTTPMTGW